MATYHSSPQIGKALTLGKAGFDLAIADEAHRCAGLVGNDFATILDKRVIRARHVLFMTATPRITAPQFRKKAEGEGKFLASMDDPEIFGNEAYRLNFGSAIELVLLADYQIDVLCIDDAEVRELVKSRRFVDIACEEVPGLW